MPRYFPSVCGNSLRTGGKRGSSLGHWSLGVWWPGLDTLPPRPASVREPKPCFRPLRAQATEVTGAWLGRANHLTSHRAKLVTLAKGDAGRETLLNLGPWCWLHRSPPDKRSRAESLPSKPQFPSWCPGVRLTTSSSPSPPFPVWECLSGPSLTLLALGSQSSPPTPSLPASMVPPVQSVGAFWDTFLRWHVPCFNFWGSPLLQDETQVLMLWALGSWLPCPFCLLTTSGCWQI